MSCSRCGHAKSASFCGHQQPTLPQHEFGLRPFFRSRKKSALKGSGPLARKGQFAESCPGNIGPIHGRGIALISPRAVGGGFPSRTEEPRSGGRHALACAFGAVPRKGKGKNGYRDISMYPFLFLPPYGNMQDCHSGSCDLNCDDNGHHHGTNRRII